jgi:phosphinothricin acetyltransferase
MNIRIARDEDLEAIVDIYNQAISAGQKTADTTPVLIQNRKEWFKEHIPDKYPILVAERDDSVIGYLTISAYRPGRMAFRHTAEVSYYIHFDHHRQGVASSLLQHTIGKCPSLRIKTLIAILIDSNDASIRLLEKYGFEKWGQLPRIVEFDEIEFDHLYYGLKIDNANKSESGES